MKSVRDAAAKAKAPLNGKKEKGESGFYALSRQMEKLRGMEPEYYLSTLKETHKGIIDIEMLLPPNKAVADSANLYPIMSKLSGGVMLRGTIDTDGQIKSFYLNNDQKNLVAFFFELPGKPVKVGDKWPISTNLLHADQSFKCDSSSKISEVTVMAIDNTGVDQIVTLQYDIHEYIAGQLGFAGMFGKDGDNKMVMSMTEKAIGKFSVAKGRWLSYEGEIAYDNEGGFSGGKTKKQLALAAQ
ncbi:MAG: hypothetical protein JKY70_22825 [Mucilaginibacter sp.]|nr:hypothetical protein [Mucilaginibacter sp.]